MNYKLTYPDTFRAELSRLVGKEKLILASASPRRSAILNQLGLKFQKIIPNINENIPQNGSPAEYAAKLARLKAQAISYNGPAIIIGADTIVVLSNRIIGKPDGREGAFRMLSDLSGQEHMVITSLILRDTISEKMIGDSARSLVAFKRLTDAEINSYIEGGEPFGKAGAYAIQGEGGRFIAGYQGDLDNIIGFPAKLFGDLLRRIRNEA